MNQKEPIDTEKFVSWKPCEEIFEQYLFSLSGMDCVGLQRDTYKNN